MTGGLHHALVEPPGGRASAWVLFLHGILGSGGNWRTIARKVVAARPELGAALVDLRMHGRSQAAAPPHTLAAAARDVGMLAEALAAAGRPVRAVVGHSFGGKVALAWRAAAPDGLRDTWVMDASPSAQPGAMERPGEDSPVRVIDALAALPRRFGTRGDFAAAMEHRGFSRALGDWLAMNLEKSGGEVELRLDLPAIRALIADYYARDLWSAALSDALPGQVQVVIAERSSALAPADRERLAAAATTDAPLLVHRVDAGHWLHLEAGAAVVELLSSNLTVA